MLFKKVHVSYIIMVVIINLFTDLYKKKVYTIRCCTIVRGGILQWTFVKPDLVLPTSIWIHKTWFNISNFNFADEHS